MNSTRFSGIALKGFASYTPGRVVDNAEVMREADSFLDGTLLYRTLGSKERHAAEKNEMGSDLMFKVGTKILQENDIDPSTIDKLICSCDPQDQAAPDAAVITQAKLALSCPAFGISMSCSGWLCGILIGSSFIVSGDNRILVLAASTVGSKYSFNNPMHRGIFGDGTGGVLLERCNVRNRGIFSLELWSDGRFFKEIFAPHLWSDVPTQIPPGYAKTFYMSPDNRIFFDAIDTHIRPFYLRQYKTARVSKKDISHFIIHQASMPLFNHTLKSLDIPRDKVISGYEKYGNTVSAELPILLDENIRNGRIREGDLVYLLTYGAGFTAAAMIAKF